MKKQIHESKELVLIGTVHGDPEGMSRLLDLLRRENPSVVAVEVSAYGIAYRQRNSRRLLCLFRRRLRRMADAKGVPWKGWGQVRAIFSQITLPFEYRASIRFCRDSGSEFHCVDSSGLSRNLIQSYWHELLDQRNIEALLKEPPEDLPSSVRKTRALASRLLQENERVYLSAFIRNWSADPEWQIREAALAESVERRYVMMERGRLAYVGGWQHLLYPTDIGTLCDQLAHLNPRRLLLDDRLESCL